jgi:hypothetical protein
VRGVVEVLADRDAERLGQRAGRVVVLRLDEVIVVVVLVRPPVGAEVVGRAALVVEVALRALAAGVVVRQIGMLRVAVD